MTQELPPSGEDSLAHLSLGKDVEYAQEYSPQLLQSVPRSLSRDQIGLAAPFAFRGFDIWNGYELSWLNQKGKPNVAILHCQVPFDTPNLIESKSFKLYLNSFNQQRLESVDALKSLLVKDLSACAGGEVSVDIIEANRFHQLTMREFEGHCIDDLDISVDHYDIQRDYLRVSEGVREETLTSNLLKSNCLITNQPDWASIMIRYRGPAIDKEGLLKYLISFRQHNEFHEQCVERIFSDIKSLCRPEKLTVYARYTRRGGLDINPFRSDFESEVALSRQARQ